MKRQKLFKIVNLRGHIVPFGFKMVIDSLKKQGHEVRDLRPSDTGGNLLVSLFWMEDIYEFIRWRKRNNIGVKYKIYIGGNHAMCYPQAVLPFCDGVFAGDGELWDGSEDMLILKGQKKEIIINKEIPNEIIKLPNKAVHTGREVSIVELTRGCRNLCHYCQYVWSKPFRAGDAGFILGQLSTFGEKAIRLVSADMMQHPDFEDIEKELIKYKINNVSQDASLLEIRRNLERIDSIKGTQRFGIDGMSERIRFANKKRLRNQEIIDLIKFMYEKGARRFLMYNIFGFPGEDESDFLEYEEFMKELIANIPAPCTFVNCWNAFMPCSLTPLQWAETSWGNDYRDKSKLLGLVECAKKQGKNCFHMPMVTGKRKITERILALRSSEKSKDLVYSVATNNRISENQILREFEKREGFPLHGKFNYDGELPWDANLIYNKDKLLGLAKKRSYEK